MPCPHILVSLSFYIRIVLLTAYALIFHVMIYDTPNWAPEYSHHPTFHLLDSSDALPLPTYIYAYLLGVSSTSYQQQYSQKSCK